MKWYYLVIGILTLFLLRFINNLYKYRQTKKLYNQYMEFLRTRDLNFVQKKEEIKALFKDAGIKDFGFVHSEPLGYGHLAPMTISGFDNMTVSREDVVANMQMRFNETIGVFKKRYTDSYNPMFWIDFLIKLPQYAFEFLGVLPEKIVVKIFLIIYWIIALLYGLKQIDIIEKILK
ncbi:MAG: hypothetical protein U1C58_00030 [Flavobacteriaceae bacterium]|nr:hypothetical protein [Flavobacteriaceae bacterium]